jgi:DNA-directed RNA polymerase subunit beta
MATPELRRLQTSQVRRFGSQREYPLPPDLTVIQTRSYEAFLQRDIPSDKRKKDQGIESVLNEIFPIESYDKQLRLEY